MKVSPDEAKDRVVKLEHNLELFNFRLSTNEKILEEIKDAVKLLVVLNQQQHSLSDEISVLRKDFEERKIHTQPYINKAESLIGKVYGVGSVIGILFALVTWVGGTNISRITELESQGNYRETQIKVLQSEVSVLKARP